MKSSSRTFVVLGAGGHAAHIIALIAAAELGRVRACFDDATERHGSEVLGIRVDGTVTELLALPSASVEAVALGIGDPLLRGRLLQQVQDRRWALPCIVHPTAVIAEGASVAAASVVDAGAVIGARAKVGTAAIIEAGVSIAHDAQVGDLTHIEAGARILAGARIGRRVRVGAGAVVSRQAVIDDDMVIAPLTLVGGLWAPDKGNNA